MKGRVKALQPALTCVQVFKFIKFLQSCSHASPADRVRKGKVELLIGENNLEWPELRVENLWKWKDGDVVPLLMKEMDFQV